MAQLYSCYHSVPTFACIRYVLSLPPLSAAGYGTKEHQSSLDLIHSSQQFSQTHQLSLVSLTVRDTVLVKLSTIPGLVGLIHCRMLSLRHSVTCVIGTESELDTELVSSPSHILITIHY